MALVHGQDHRRGGRASSPSFVFVFVAIVVGFGVPVPGTVTATAFKGDGSDLTGTISVTNGANNRVVTAASTSALNAESNFTFDGSTLAVTGAITGSTTITVPTLDVNVIQSTDSTAVQINEGINVSGAITTSTGFTGNLTGQVNSITVGSNATGTRTVSSSTPSGGSDGDIWYRV